MHRSVRSDAAADDLPDRPRVHVPDLRGRSLRLEAAPQPRRSSDRPEARLGRVVHGGRREPVDVGGLGSRTSGQVEATQNESLRCDRIRLEAALGLKTGQ